ncbi:response regulator transcription factor [Enterococcus faecalis]|nr:response regulator transcription factor [Enterococcus faecalis]
MHKNILLVDDEVKFSNLLKNYLEREGYIVYLAKSVAEAYNIYNKNIVNLIIISIDIQEKDSYEFIINILEKNITLPFIFTTSKKSYQNMLYSLTLGADDYILKPFEPIELVLRVKNILRRVYGEQKNCLRIKELAMNLENRHVQIGEHILYLTDKEFSILWILAKQPGKVFTKSEILSIIWKDNKNELEADYRIINVHIHHLREKLNKIPLKKGIPIIKTVWGIGYQFKLYY